MCKSFPTRRLAGNISLRHDMVENFVAIHMTRSHLAYGQCGAPVHHASLEGGPRERVVSKTCIWERSTLRRRRAHCVAVAKAGKRRSPHGATDAMQRLRTLLHSMEQPQRRDAISSLAPSVRAALLDFMQREQTGEITQKPNIVHCSRSHQRLSVSSNACVGKQARQRGAAPFGIRTIRLAGGVRYQPQVHIKALRLYASKQTTLEIAAVYQDLLVRVREALLAASVDEPLFWLDHRRVAKVCSKTFCEFEVTENEIGLRTFVHMRAARWLGQGVQIASPVVRFAEAARVHARLLHARAASWDAFRAEWLKLLQSAGQSKRKRMSAWEAEAVVDGARRSALQRQLVQAARSALRALGTGSKKVPVDCSMKLLQDGRARCGGRLGLLR